LPIVACLAILVFVRFLYRRDSVELHPVAGWLLTALRTAVFLGILVLYLQPHWRSERDVVRNSRALLLVDTSLSMGQDDGDKSSGDGNRDQQIANLLEDTDFLPRLRATHDVAVYQFGEDLLRDRVVSLPKTTTEASRSAADPNKADARQSGDQTPAAENEGKPVDWKSLLTPSGVETRLGQALRQLIHDERGSPVSGIVLFSDGGQNSGISPDVAVAMAQEAKIPVFTVGIGSDRKPMRARVSDLVVPARAYPGDHYTVTGYLQAQGMAGKTVTVQVLSRAAAEGDETGEQRSGEVVASREVTLGDDGEVLPVKFDLTPETTGRRTIVFRIQGDAGKGDSADQAREADIEIVDRKNHVLLLAGGPTREYQFLRSQLFRDRSTTVDVLLQTGQEGISQDAKKVLTEFPTTREQLFDYDCIVGFDPNWQAIGPESAALLETWVAEQGGGLIVLGGAVYAGKTINGWLQDAAMKPVQNLYPVEFPRRLTAVETTMYTTKEAWPIEFTREGLDAEFLWLGDTATASRQAWASFPGVFSFCPVRGAKPGATVYAKFADPRANQGSEQPVYLAGQFYGSGRVFYLGSGEIWRTRAVDESYFEQFYTKLIRHVSQGRLLRGSSRGVLLVGQDRCMVGNTVEVRAQLTNSRLEPLDVPSVNLEVALPNGAMQTTALRRDATRAGAYVGQIPVLQEGTYRLDLPIPESDRERLSRRVQVRVPDLERENPRRNDALLSAIAKGTGGKYFVGIPSMLSGKGGPTLISQLPDRTNTMILTAAPNPKWDETWLRWLMTLLCSVLCLEWLIRRLLKLA
jgi:hypothetical protein